ncbi:MAG TPA: hypothetical protein VF715_14880 [Thermoleophilaceae bacterium]
MKRTLSTLVIAGCAAALAPAGAAAAKPRTATFQVQVIGTQTTTWKEPRRSLYGDCEGQRWSEGSGQETIEFRTKQRKVVIREGGGRPKVRLAGRGTVDRTGQRIFGIDPGPCFDGGPVTEDTGPYDCRVIGVDYVVDIDWAETLAAVANPPAGRTPRFENCPHVAAYPVIPAKFTVVRSKPFRAKALFGKAKSHEVAGQADYRRDEQFSSTETRVRWTIRFKPVK